MIYKPAYELEKADEIEMIFAKHFARFYEKR
jgi:hypothetical protein